MKTIRIKDVSTSKSTVKHLEVPPAQGLFEWDERAESLGEEGSVDGMAILTSKNEKGGYMGDFSNKYKRTFR